MENQKLKTARELVRSPRLTPSLAMQILTEVERDHSPDLPAYMDLPNLIITGFEWAKSPQGVDYWNDLYEQLREKHRTQCKPYEFQMLKYNIISNSKSKFTRIKPPTYRIGEYVLNEYELRYLQIEVAWGEKEPGMKVIDEKGNVATILPNGSIDNDLYGLSMTTDFKFAFLKLKMDNEKHN